LTKREKGVVFIAPKLVAQISFQEWTADRKFRQPVFLGLRDDKCKRRALAGPAFSNSANYQLRILRRLGFERYE
jgi:ATP-dependent DNA ligase